jgi:hypothetical protein
MPAALIAFAAFLSVNTWVPPQPSSRPDASFCQWRGGQDDDTGRPVPWPSARCADDKK